MDTRTPPNHRVEVERRTAELGPPESVEDRRRQVEHVDFDEHVEITPAMPELTVG